MLFPGSHRLLSPPQFHQHHVEHGREQQSENRHADHAGEDRDAHRLTHLGTRTLGSDQRENARDESDGGHQDRTQTQTARLNGRVERREVFLVLFVLRELDDEIAFLHARPTSTMRPICVKMLLSPPFNHTPPSANSKHNGTTRMIANGNRKLSYCAASTRNTSRMQSG